jgi:hypothetical protein
VFVFIVHACKYVGMCSFVNSCHRVVLEPSQRPDLDVARAGLDLADIDATDVLQMLVLSLIPIPRTGYIPSVSP